MFKVGEKVIWSTSRGQGTNGPHSIVVVKVLWIGPELVTPWKDRPVVLIEVPGRDYYQRYVLVPGRALSPIPPPRCPVSMRPVNATISYQCLKEEGHTDKHKTDVGIWAGNFFQEVEVEWINRKDSKISSLKLTREGFNATIESE